ncbi:serine hydrolase [Candidatus Kaiserbacteria bacterium]|nr:serine hydrolase [Candidatus Kaiserbacteria bacterium]
MQARVTIGVLIVGAILFGALLRTESVTSLLRIENTAGTASGILPPAVSARNVLVYDVTADDVVYGRKTKETRPIASITKLFTAYAAYTSARLDTVGNITWADLQTEGDAGSLSYGEVYTPRELLFPLLLLSSNDAGAALLRMIGEGVFQERIATLVANAELSHTSIVDSTGLSSQNVSTAEDLKRLVLYLQEYAPHLLDITRLSSYQGTHAGWLNNNPGQKFDGWVGGKHGYLPSAGRTFVGIFEQGHTYVVVLLGSADLSEDLEVVLKEL